MAADLHALRDYASAAPPATEAEAIERLRRLRRMHRHVDALYVDFERLTGVPFPAPWIDISDARFEEAALPSLAFLRRRHPGSPAARRAIRRFVSALTT